MRRAIAPFLATGVVISGAAVVVANPVVPLPSDIRVSASDFTADGHRLDVLDPEFLQSIGAIRQDWLSSIEVLQRLFNDVSTTGRDSVISAFGTGLTYTEPAIPLSVEDFAPNHERSLVSHTPTPLPVGVPSDAIGNVVGALTDIGTSFGEAGITFVKQVSMAPAVALVLTQQVVQQLLTGKIGPDEALRRLIVEPLTALLAGHPNLTGIEEIDKAFHESALKPLIRALIRNLPKPIGKPGGLIDHVDQTVDDVAGEIRDGAAPTTKPGTTAQSQLPSTGTAPQLPVIIEEPAAGDAEVPTKTVRPSTAKLPKAGDLAKEFGVRVQQGLDNMQSTIKRLTQGPKKNTPSSTKDTGDATTGGKNDDADQDADTSSPNSTSSPDEKPSDKPAGNDDGAQS
ncbi:hypothetical protein [Mycobacterium sp. GA-2829]|uniref:hypothetical protein n=1 Tax=Mycobacterium sp. GA-2829 TaxID=1772283 RepID=UPI001E29DA44|nr:hypothetical protein [Mycobacterium sp. GA-2829]